MLEYRQEPDGKGASQLVIQRHIPSGFAMSGGEGAGTVSERHPALVELREANATWDKHGGGPSSLLAVADAAARQVVEWLSESGFTGTDFFSDPVFYMPRDKWAALRAAVGLGKEGEGDAEGL